MKLIEILLVDPRDEYNENYMHYFIKSPIVHVFPNTGHLLKRDVDSYGDVRYGIFDNKQQVLISYLHLDKQGDWYVASMPSTMRQFRGQGLMTFLYAYAVTTDNLKVMSAVQQTPEAKNMWKSFASRGLFGVSLFDQQTQEVKPWTTEIDPWDRANVNRYRLVALPHTTEELALLERYSSQRGERAARRRMGINDYSQFGPGTSSDLYWNW